MTPDPRHHISQDQVKNPQHDHPPMGWSFHFGDIHGRVCALGGMLGPIWFRMSDGREVQPFAVAPWANDPSDRLSDLPPILKGLRGEFPCVPFGSPVARRDMPERWSQGVDFEAVSPDDFMHGYAANHEWYLVKQDANEIVIAIDYPQDHVVRRLERRISPGSDLTLEITLCVEVRRDATLPIGIHPIFALPDRIGAARLHIPSLESVRSFPAAVDDRSIFAPDRTGLSLRQIPLKDGGMIDMSALPLAQDTEELQSVQLADGEVQLVFPLDRHAIVLSWDIAVFSQCLLWLSNYGRTEHPWNGRFCAIGIEPVTSAFDLGAAYAASSCSPFVKADVTTELEISALKPLQTRYFIALRQLDDSTRQRNIR